MLLVGSFAIGAVLELLRSVPAVAANWRWDTALVLAAAWCVGVLAVRWPGTSERALPRLMALLLLVLFVGTLAMHYLLNQH